MSLHSVINILAKHSCKEEGCAPIPIAECIIPTQIQLWLSTPSDSAVFKRRRSRSFASPLSRFCIMNIISRNSLFIITSKLVCIESTQRLSFHNHLSPTFRRDTCYTRVTLSKWICTVLLIRQAINLVRVMRQIKCSLPCEIPILHRDCIDREFDTIVGYLTYIGSNVINRVNERRYRIIPY